MFLCSPKIFAIFSFVPTPSVEAIKRGFLNLVLDRSKTPPNPPKDASDPFVFVDLAIGAIIFISFSAFFISTPADL